MSPEMLATRLEEQRTHRVVETCTIIFEQMVSGDTMEATIRVDSFQNLAEDRLTDLPKSDQEWDLVVAAIIKAGWQCKMLRLNAVTPYSAIKVAAPGKEF